MHKEILLVDDDWGICNSLAMLLRNEGYKVDATSDSKEAVTFIKKDRYEACLFDYKMKDLNGIDLLKMAKKLNPQCSVFIISGMLSIDKLCQKEIDAGLVADIIHKPFDVEALLERIAAVVN